MPKFFQTEIEAYNGEKPSQGFSNIKFKKGDFENSTAATAGTILEIIPVHIKNPPVIQFMAYITNLSDTFSPDYNTESPYGRVDSYHVWKASRREISLGFAIPSSSVSKGLDNLNNLSWLLASLYPTYKETENATSIAASPLFRVRNANLIASPTANGQGILCIMRNVMVKHELSEGVIAVNPEKMGSRRANVAARVIKDAGFEHIIGEGDRLLIPKLITISCNLVVLHDHEAGWNSETGEWRGGLLAPGYPYLFGLSREATDPPPAGPGVGLSGDVSAGAANDLGLAAAAEASRPSGAQARSKESIAACALNAGTTGGTAVTPGAAGQTTKMKCP
jgi:hypothetical protein